MLFALTCHILFEAAFRKRWKWHIVNTLNWKINSMSDIVLNGWINVSHVLFLNIIHHKHCNIQVYNLTAILRNKKRFDA